MNDENEKSEETPEWGMVSLWKNAKGERQWQVKVALNATREKVDNAIELALEAARRLENS